MTKTLSTDVPLKEVIANISFNISDTDNIFHVVKTTTEALTNFWQNVVCIALRLAGGLTILE